MRDHNIFVQILMHRDYFLGFRLVSVLRLERWVLNLDFYAT
jgi:hypothetical protein